MNTVLAERTPGTASELIAMVVNHHFNEQEERCFTVAYVGIAETNHVNEKYGHNGRGKTRD